MKKYLYYVAPLCVAVAASACSQDEITEISEDKSNGGQEIEFHLDMQSRAADRTIANLDTIWVYADDGTETIFEATPFIKDQYGNFKSEQKIFWPDGTDNITFTAFWPSPERLNSDPNKEYTKTLSDYNEANYNHIVLSPNNCIIRNSTGFCTNSHYDLITATTQTTKQEANAGIALSFTHAYAQVDFKAKIDPSAEHSVVIHSVYLCNPYYRSTYSITNNKWENPSYINNIYTGPAKLLTVNSEPQSLTDKCGPFYIKDQTFNFDNEYNYQIYLKVVLKVYRGGKQIYPTPDQWTEEEKGKRMFFNPAYAKVFPFNIPEDYGCAKIPLGSNTLDIKAGHKYIFTIDFTNGIGIHLNGDPTKPGEPILDNPISAKVTIEEWNGNNLQVDA